MCLVPTGTVDPRGHDFCRRRWLITVPAGGVLGLWLSYTIVDSKYLLDMADLTFIFLFGIFGSIGGLMVPFVVPLYLAGHCLLWTINSLRQRHGSRGR